MEKDELIKVAERLNDQFGLQPKIDKNLPEKELIEKILVAWDFRVSRDVIPVWVQATITRLLKEKNS